MDVDTTEHRMHIVPCDYSHIDFCYRVSLETLSRKISEISTPYQKDIQKMNELLKWKFGIFMRPHFKKESNGLFSYQCFWDWDTKGVSLPESLEDPEILEDLVQSKKNREFTIDQWVETYKLKDEYPIFPEEYLDHPGMDEKLFQTLFGRTPNENLLKIFI
jgi:hypothetical protein